jgi:hypothetical protein
LVAPWDQVAVNVYGDLDAVVTELVPDVSERFTILDEE